VRRATLRRLKVESFSRPCAASIGFKLQFNDKPVQWPRSRYAYVADPDGILIEFTERFGGGLD
jgi:catechol 2,3-dioxygenase-like lactoylglutathione lyase family enzyme